MRIIHESVSKHLLHTYKRYKQYYDGKASAHPLTTNDYCYALHTQANNQGSKLPFRECLWTGLLIVMKTLPNNNNLIRKLQTNKTQILHRIRLKPCPTKDRLPDIQVQAEDFQPDNEVEILHSDLIALAWQSGFEHFRMLQCHSTSSEPTIVPVDNWKKKPENVAQEDTPDILPVSQKFNQKPTQTRNLDPLEI